jgi:hypothetical protein
VEKRNLESKIGCPDNKRENRQTSPSYEACMPKKKTADDKPASVRVGNISGVSGSVNIAGGNITTRQTTRGLSTADIKQLFERLNITIEASTNSTADKEDLKAEVKEIQATVANAVQKKGKVDEGSLSRRFRNIARIAPDVLEVVVATLANPLAGLGVAVKKIAEKTKEETG